MANTTRTAFNDVNAILPKIENDIRAIDKEIDLLRNERQKLAATKHALTYTPPKRTVKPKVDPTVKSSGDNKSDK